MKDGLRITVVQNAAGLDVDANLARIGALLTHHAPSDLIALPELFSLRGGDEDYRASAASLSGQVCAAAAWAKRFGCWVLAGSLVERDGRRTFNTSVLLARDGRIAASYRKIHLFDHQGPDGTWIRESDVYKAGGEPVMADVDGWRCGLSVCYDLRFPELYRRYADAAADILFVPANFTRSTGEAHWETLVRARAIENQCFVVAPDQCGVNPITSVESYGHSLVVNPWGEVLADAGEDETVMTVDLDREQIRKARTRLPALEHRKLRPD